jgi:hypothetical protein
MAAASTASRIFGRAFTPSPSYDGLQSARAGRVQITSAFTASVNAQLAPGPVAETVTVTAATPASMSAALAAATTLPANS